MTGESITRKAATAGGFHGRCKVSNSAIMALERGGSMALLEYLW